MAHQGYGFCEFLTEEDAEYACKIMNQIKLWGKPIRVNKVCEQIYRGSITKAFDVRTNGFSFPLMTLLFLSWIDLGR